MGVSQQQLRNFLRYYFVLAVIIFRQMKSRRSDKVKNRGSLQKTSSTVFNIHTHRHSNISDTLPLYYNDSMLSIRASSLHRFKNSQVPPPPKFVQSTSENKFQKKRMLLRQIGHHHYSKQKETQQHYLKSKRSNLSREKKVEKRSGARSQSKNQNKKNSALTQSMHNCLQQQKESRNANLNDLLQRNKEILDNYRHYTEELRKDRDRYKKKYKQVLNKFKKHELK